MAHKRTPLGEIDFFKLYITMRNLQDNGKTSEILGVLDYILSCDVIKEGEKSCPKDVDYKWINTFMVKYKGFKISAT